MKTSSPTTPASVFPSSVYYQLVHTLTGLLPPPIDDTPAALHTRNHAAIAKVAALLPVNADEADLAAQCIAARAQAEDLLRLLRQHAGDIGLVMRLNAQYASMLRASLSVHARLMRVQALRRKRESVDGAATQDAWALHIAERSMMTVIDPDARLPQPAWPEPPPPPPEAPQAPDVHRTTDKPVSETDTNSHQAAFETWLSAQVSASGPDRLDGSRLHQAVRQAMAEPPSAGQASPANIRTYPGRADHGCHVERETASA